MESFSISEIVEMAVRTEHLGYQFYSEMAGRFGSDKDLRRLFETLAEKEKRHEEIFLALKGHVTPEEPEGRQEAAEYLRAIVESEFFLGKEKSLPAMKDIKTVARAVAFALGFEKETLLFYAGLRDAVKEKNTLDAIIIEERSHIVWLKGFKQGGTASSV